MNYLSVDGISKNFGDKQLFTDISFGLEQGQKTALIGINGSGKSTLLKIIAGLETPDTGDVTHKNGILISYLNQEPDLNPQISVIDAVFEGDNETLSVIREYESELEKGANINHKNLNTLIEKMDTLQAWDYEAQIKEILGKMGISEMDKKIEELSGGQKKRVAIARALIEKPDLLIMDEPTNHLDIETIEWLEEYLSGQNLSLLLVTHDRYFLDRVTNHILELSNENIYSYKGNYEKYLINKALRLEQQTVEAEKAGNLMKKEQEWIRRQPKARGTKAKYRIDAFEDLKKKARDKPTESKLKLDITEKRLGKTILEAKAISKSYEDKSLLDNFSYVFRTGERLGIIGQNGTGKSTFLNLVTGRVRPDSGEVITGVNTRFGYYSQEGLTYKKGQKVIDMVKEIAEVIEMSDGRTITASQFLNHFNFSPKKQFDFVEKLSGGERRRLQLLKVLIKNPNFLILDEPTNDLDLATLNTLEDFLISFNGCLIVVSHDRYFLDKTVDHIFVFAEGKEIKDFPGNYSQYRERIKKETPESGNQGKEKKTPPKVKTSENKWSYKDKLEFEGLEKEIEALEEEKERISIEMDSGDIDQEHLIKLSMRVEEIIGLLNKKEMRWLELSEKAG